MCDKSTIDQITTKRIHINISVQNVISRGYILGGGVTCSVIVEKTTVSAPRSHLEYLPRVPCDELSQVRLPRGDQI